MVRGSQREPSYLRADIRPTAIVEQVRDGSSIRVRLLLEDGSHQFVNLVSLTLEETQG
jgi:hypothetical protein